MNRKKKALKEIELRSAERTCATLRVEADGRKLLCHQLSEDELKTLEGCQWLVAYEGSEQLVCNLAVRDQGPCVELAKSSGELELRLFEGEDGELFEVVDPKGDAELKVALQGTGSAGTSPLQEGYFVLKLCRVKRDPQTMLGKPVIRGTRLTVEFILRRLATGATEADLLRDYPQLTRADIREALTYAANFLSTRAQAAEPLQVPQKP